MMSSGRSLKSVLLALSVVCAVPVTTTRTSEAATTPMTCVVNFAKTHPMLIGFSLFGWFVAHRRLVTKSKPTVDYAMADLKDDFKEFLASLNIFDTAMYKQVLYMIDKYIIGLQVKIDEAATRTRNEDGSVLTIKGKKLMQKPFGLYGCIHAYVLSDMEKFTAYIPMLATMYLLLNNPIQAIQNTVPTAIK